MLGKYIKAAFFKPVPVAIAFIVGGLIILWAERRKHAITVESVDDMTWRDALKVGCAQAFALIPGTSRSGATIIGGLLFGMSRRAATEFSFFLAVPTLIAAGAYDHQEPRAVRCVGYRHIRGRHGGVVHLRVCLRALAAALYREPRFHAVRLVPYRVWADRARNRLLRPRELARLSVRCRGGNATETAEPTTISFATTAGRRAPAARRVAVAARVAIASNPSRTCTRRDNRLRRRRRRFVRPAAAAAQEHNDCVGGYLLFELIYELRVGPHARIAFPLDFNAARHAADEVEFGAAAHVDELGAGLVLQEGVGFGGQHEPSYGSLGARPLAGGLEIASMSAIGDSKYRFKPKFYSCAQMAQFV